MVLESSLNFHSPILANFACVFFVSVQMGRWADGVRRGNNSLIGSELSLVQTLCMNIMHLSALSQKPLPHCG